MRDFLPVLWWDATRAARATGFHSQRAGLALLLTLVALAPFAEAAIRPWAMMSFGRPLDAGDLNPFDLLARSATTAAFSLAAVSGMAAMATERGRRTLDPLRTTPLGDGAIALEKTAAAALVGWSIAAAAAPAMTVLAPLSGYEGTNVAATLADAVAAAWLGAGAGLLVGSSRPTWFGRATAYAAILGVAAARFVLPPGVGLFLGQLSLGFLFAVAAAKGFGWEQARIAPRRRWLPFYRAGWGLPTQHPIHGNPLFLRARQHPLFDGGGAWWLQLLAPPIVMAGVGFAPDLSLAAMALAGAVALPLLLLLAGHRLLERGVLTELRHTPIDTYTVTTGLESAAHWAFRPLYAWCVALCLWGAAAEIAVELAAPIDGVAKAERLTIVALFRVGQLAGGWVVARYLVVTALRNGVRDGTIGVKLGQLAWTIAVAALASLSIVVFAYLIGRLAHRAAGALFDGFCRVYGLWPELATAMALPIGALLAVRGFQALRGAVAMWTAANRDHLGRELGARLGFARFVT